VLFARRDGFFRRLFGRVDFELACIHYYIYLFEHYYIYLFEALFLLFLLVYRVCIYSAMRKHFSSVEQIYRQNKHRWRAPLDRSFSLKLSCQLLSRSK
jgi:hypothetical protein